MRARGAPARHPANPAAMKLPLRNSRSLPDSTIYPGENRGEIDFIKTAQLK